MDSNNVGKGCAVMVGIVLLVGMLAPASQCSSRRSSGGYYTEKFDSATRKIDAGRADQITKDEAQVLDDVVNYCEICKKPLRSCPHGK